MVVASSPRCQSTRSLPAWVAEKLARYSPRLLGSILDLLDLSPETHREWLMSACKTIGEPMPELDWFYERYDHEQPPPGRDQRVEKLRQAIIQEAAKTPIPMTDALLPLSKQQYDRIKTDAWLAWRMGLPEGAKFEIPVSALDSLKPDTYPDRDAMLALLVINSRRGWHVMDPDIVDSDVVNEAFFKSEYSKFVLPFRH
ncbi:hypothetical protein PG984_014128 [Apiospora sp. TS-2023a]